MELWSTLQSAVEQVIIQQVEQFIIYCLKYIYFSHSNLPQIKSLSVDNQVKCQIFNIPLYFTGIATCIYIYIQYARMLQTTAFVAQSVERWSRDPEVAGSIPSWRPWSCIFRNWSLQGLKMHIALICMARSVGKYLHEVFVQTERRKSEVFTKKAKTNIFHTDR